jgi:hypothetical protein
MATEIALPHPLAVLQQATLKLGRALHKPLASRTALRNG